MPAILERIQKNQVAQIAGSMAEFGFINPRQVFKNISAILTPMIGKVARCPHKPRAETRQ